MAMKASLNPALRSFWLTKARYRILYGGRASSKSWDAAGVAVKLARAVKIKVMCCRQFQNRIEESVYSLLKEQIYRFGYTAEFKITNSSIIHLVTGSSFFFYGLARNFEEVKSAEGVDILWIEESQFLTSAQWEVLDPTIRKDGSQVWLIFNPGIVSDFVWQNFVVHPMPNSVVRKIDYIDNPFLSDTMRQVIENAKERFDDDDFSHIYLGEPRTNDDDAVIKRSWVLSAIDAHKTLGFGISGSSRIGYDVADSGQDKNAIIRAVGSVAVYGELWSGKDDDLLGSCSKVYHTAKADKCAIIYDSIGVGAGCGSKFKELNAQSSVKVNFSAFNSGGAVIDPDEKYAHDTLNKDFFANRKAQEWWRVADRFRNTHNAITKGQDFSPSELISIDSGVPDIQLLIDELSTPKRDFDGAGKVKVESKKDLAKRSIKSPNYADAFIMAFVKPSKNDRGFNAAAMQRLSERL
jgi:phage terminase large subunit